VEVYRVQQGTTGGQHFTWTLKTGVNLFFFLTSAGINKKMLNVNYCKLYRFSSINTNILMFLFVLSDHCWRISRLFKFTNQIGY
jgi:hypothetical protein